ncbi:uncharacterized protein B0H18DRAFT_1209790 [Fomitopsis serialis]|uniref:uncharacterized protein n=1 Tax=Fomitopsis serialis TaxID=139415 RepID=UPI00200859B7|nr:uncharacterized protein B0H18DRAFT_1209790 [Neoantrodia serialis]KAH9929326.1 hypothetical protein B0H18DRAFT_1209790 [Neoantrodia serialis]
MSDVDDDTLIHLFSFLPVRSILAMRQTCRRIQLMSRTRIVWRNAYIAQVLFAGYPFPRRELASMDTAQLEHAVRRAIRIGAFWRSPEVPLREASEFHASFGTGVTDVRFLPGHDGRRLATLSKGIWSVITCWETSVGGAGVRIIAKWSPKSTIITGLVVNSDAGSDALIATSTHGERQRIELLSLAKDAKGSDTLQSLGVIDAAMRPIALQGDLLAYGDESSQTVITNWRTGEIAHLQGADEPVDLNFQASESEGCRPVSLNYNRYLQVVFAHKSILVVRARSIELFPEPVLRPPHEPCPSYRPLARYSFGWIDGVSVNVQTRGQDVDSAVKPLSILLRAESDDPWMSDTHMLDLFVLEPNPAYTADDPPQDPATDTTEDPTTSAGPGEDHARHPLAPYIFPPVHSGLSSPSVRGILRCTDIVLGPHGTAVWIMPRGARSADLTALDVHQSEVAGAGLTAQQPEVLAGAMFAGPMLGAEGGDGGEGEDGERGSGVRARTVYVRRAASGSAGNWTAMDYVEELGVVALASSQGMVTVLELG